MRKWYPWLLVGLALAFSAAVYAKLPDRVPTNWGPGGGINDDASRPMAAWLMPIVLIVMAIILPRLPALDPRRENYEKFRPSYDLVIHAVMTMIAVLHVAVLGAAALGWPVSMERLMPVLVGVLFVVMGNVMPRARPNWLFGIRTPWTLSNDRVWERTHRLGGVMFVIAGLLLTASAFLIPRAMFVVLMAGAVISASVPVIYSYFAWKQETARAPNP